MSKAVIILALFAVVASASFLGKQPTPKDFSALFSGFNDQLAIASDDDFNKCAHVPIIADIQKLYADLNADKPNPIALVKDVTVFYNDYQKVKVACPHLEKTYEAFFDVFIQSAQQHPELTALKVGTNVITHVKELIATAHKIQSDIEAENYYTLGSDLGRIVQITLAGFI